jgi:hypothetical protein
MLRMTEDFFQTMKHNTKQHEKDLTLLRKLRSSASLPRTPVAASAVEAANRSAVTATAN